MTDPGDKLSARYRELAREEPSAALDAKILAAARGLAPVTREALRADSGARARFSRWAGPVSIAAVLVLGIGVSLRMQLEEPGIETSVPSASSAEYPAPAAESMASERTPEPDQAKAAEARSPQARPVEAPPAAKVLRKERAAGPPARADSPRPEATRSVTPETAPKPFPDAPVSRQAPTAPARSPAAPPPTTTFSASTVPPTPPAQAAPAQAPAAQPPEAPAESMNLQRMAPRAKREAMAADTAAGATAARAAAEADPDPVRELERIATLRAAGRQAEADRALEQFRRRHPDFRIPEATWERVRPR